MSAAAELQRVLPLELVNVVLAYSLDFQCNESGSNQFWQGSRSSSREAISLDEWIRSNHVSDFPSQNIEWIDTSGLVTSQPHPLNALSLSISELRFESGRTLQKELAMCETALPCNIGLNCVSLDRSCVTLHFYLRGSRGKTIGPFIVVIDTSFPRTAPRVCAVPSLFDIFGDAFAELQLADFQFSHAWKPMFTCSLLLLWIILGVCRHSEFLPVNIAMAHRMLGEKAKSHERLSPYQPVFVKGITSPGTLYQKARPDPRVFAEVSEAVTQTYRYIAHFRDITTRTLWQIGLASVVVQIIVSYRGIYDSEIALSVFVKDIDGSQYPVRVLEQATFHHITVALERKWHDLRFRLIHRGALVDPQTTFRSCNIMEGDKIYVVATMRGG